MKLVFSLICALFSPLALLLLSPARQDPHAAKCRNGQRHWSNGKSVVICRSMDSVTQQLTRKNLHQLWWLRNIAIACEIMLVALATFVLRVDLPIDWLLLIICGQLAVNALAWRRLRHEKPISHLWVLLPLLVDVTALFALLSLSGGASNPFTSLFILQVIIAATLLPPRHTWAVTGTAIGYYTLLIVYWTDNAAMQMHHNHSGHETGGGAFDLHVYGMWGSFVILALLVAWFVTRMQATIQRQSQLLAASEQVAMLGTIATTAAHELGTPLSSIALLAELIEQEGAERERLALLKGQITRCKDIISHMALKANVMRAESGQARDASDWLASIVKRWQARHPETDLQAFLTGSLNQVQVVAEYALEQAIFNLLDNAAEASPDVVQMDAFITRDILTVRISDEGDGFTQDMLTPDALLHPIGTSKPGGMGMGLYLTRMVTERLHGNLSLSNRQNGGGCVNLALPLARIRP